jgi:hypothetical protein
VALVNLSNYTFSKFNYVLNFSVKHSKRFDKLEHCELRKHPDILGNITA